MDATLCDDFLRLEKAHWWSMAQRAVIKHLLDGKTLATSPQILDAGCGGGACFALLSRFGAVYGMDPDEKMLAAAKARASAPVEQGSLPGNIPFSEHQFDLVTLLNVLEYIKDDRAALIALRQRMKTRGLLLLAVPAHKWMYHNLDRQRGRYRRYSRRELRQLLESAGFQIEFISYWNIIFFPLGIIRTGLERLNICSLYPLSQRPKGRTLNRLLARLSASERYIMPHFAIPMGMTHLVFARKPAPPTIPIVKPMEDAEGYEDNILADRTHPSL